MVLEGVRLMAVGMFTVFAFLTLLVGAMHAMAAFVAANADRFPEEAPEPTGAARSNEGEIALAIAVADALRRGRKVD